MEKPEQGSASALTSSDQPFRLPVASRPPENTPNSTNPVSAPETVDASLSSTDALNSTGNTRTILSNQEENDDLPPLIEDPTESTGENLPNSNNDADLPPLVADPEESNQSEKPQQKTESSTTQNSSKQENFPQPTNSVNQNSPAISSDPANDSLIKKQLDAMSDKVKEYILTQESSQLSSERYAKLIQSIEEKIQKHLKLTRGTAEYKETLSSCINYLFFEVISPFLVPVWKQQFDNPVIDRKITFLLEFIFFNTLNIESIKEINMLSQAIKYAIKTNNFPALELVYCYFEDSSFKLKNGSDYLRKRREKTKAEIMGIEENPQNPQLQATKIKALEFIGSKTDPKPISDLISYDEKFVKRAGDILVDGINKKNSSEFFDPSKDSKIPSSLTSQGKTFFKHFLCICDAYFSSEIKKSHVSQSIHPAKVKKLIQAFQEKAAVLSLDLEYGNTALHLACAALNFELIAILIELGADISIKNAHNKTPLDLLIGLIKIHGEYNYKILSKERCLELLKLVLFSNDKLNKKISESIVQFLLESKFEELTNKVTKVLLFDATYATVLQAVSPQLMKQLVASVEKLDIVNTLEKNHQPLVLALEKDNIDLFDTCYEIIEKAWEKLENSKDTNATRRIQKFEKWIAESIKFFETRRATDELASSQPYKRLVSIHEKLINKKSTASDDKKDVPTSSTPKTQTEKTKNKKAQTTSANAKDRKKSKEVVPAGFSAQKVEQESVQSAPSSVNQPIVATGSQDQSTAVVPIEKSPQSSESNKLSKPHASDKKQEPTKQPEVQKQPKSDKQQKSVNSQPQQKQSKSIKSQELSKPSKPTTRSEQPKPAQNTQQAISQKKPQAKTTTSTPVEQKTPSVIPKQPEEQPPARSSSAKIFEKLSKESAKVPASEEPPPEDTQQQTPNDDSAFGKLLAANAGQSLPEMPMTNNNLPNAQQQPYPSRYVGSVRHVVPVVQQPQRMLVMPQYVVQQPVVPYPQSVSLVYVQQPQVPVRIPVAYVASQPQLPVRGIPVTYFVPQPAAGRVMVNQPQLVIPVVVRAQLPQSTALSTNNQANYQLSPSIPVQTPRQHK